MGRWPLKLVAAVGLALVAGSALIAGSALAQTAAPVRIRGTIDAVDGPTLQVTSRTGEKMALHLTADAAVTAILPASLADIKEGTFVGTAAMPGPNETIVALEVHIFPENRRGTGEGHHPFDLRPQSTMTNAAAGNVVATTDGGRSLTLSYKGGEQKLTIPKDTPIVTYESGSKAMLKPGAHFNVMATRAADGTLTANRINVGKDGLVPPM